jgi:hypothetical protein
MEFFKIILCSLIAFIFIKESDTILNSKFLISILIIGIIIFKMQSFKDQRFNFVFFTMIPDFCRGEIGTFIYQFFFISFFIILLPNLLKNISKGKNSNLN